MPIKLLHIADLHLDRPFVGLAVEHARARRRGLREALDRALSLAAERQVELITIGGDLWEEEHVLQDTCLWVADRLGRAGVPVVLIAGNHDPLRAGSAYERVRWPENVHVLEAGRLQERRFGELSVWGASWGAAPLRASFLEGFSVPRDGRSHCLLVHGTLVSALSADSAHCPFTAGAVRTAGFSACLAGHIHAGGVREQMVVYPGSPEPLAWDETGTHSVALVELEPGAAPAIELVDVNRVRNAQIVVDCDGAASSADLERMLRSAIERERTEPSGGRLRAPGQQLYVRALLRGQIEVDCEVDLEGLAAAVGRGLGAAVGTDMGALELVDQTSRAFDLDALGSQRSALGAFVRDMQGRIEACSPEEREQRARLELALQLGLRAMHGQELELCTAA